MFMVGVAMPYSYASRRIRGHSPRKQLSHALIRAIVLVLIGVFLQTQRNWFDTYNLFTNVLAQIGLGYFFVYLLLGRSAKLQIGAAAIVLTIYGAWLVLFPVPDPLPAAAAESIQSLSVPENIARHYAIGTNAAAQADLALLNLIPHDQPLQTHPAGYATLNFIPAAITMLLGVLAGTLLNSSVPARDKVVRLLLGGLLCMTVAVTASYTVCPVIKKIWTPAWTLYSGAYVLWTLAALYWLIDVKQWRRWTFPLVVVGTNSLAMYLMGMLIKRWIADRYRNYFGPEIFSGIYGPTVQAVCVFAVLWLICLYLYRSKLFFRI
jgi:predicted acyltransferase